MQGHQKKRVNIQDSAPIAEILLIMILGFAAIVLIIKNRVVTWIKIGCLFAIFSFGYFCAASKH